MTEARPPSVHCEEEPWKENLQLTWADSFLPWVTQLRGLPSTSRRLVRESSEQSCFLTSSGHGLWNFELDWKVLGSRGSFSGSKMLLRSGRGPENSYVTLERPQRKQLPGWASSGSPCGGGETRGLSSRKHWDPFSGSFRACVREKQSHRGHFCCYSCSSPCQPSVASISETIV